MIYANIDGLGVRAGWSEALPDPKLSQQKGPCTQRKIDDICTQKRPSPSAWMKILYYMMKVIDEWVDEHPPMSRLGAMFIPSENNIDLFGRLSKDSSTPAAVGWTRL